MWGYGIEGKGLGPGHIFLTICGFGLFLGLLSVCPMEYVNYIALYSTLLSTLSKLPQIMLNFRTKRLGVQSWVTHLTSLLGVCAKLFINVRETPDDLNLIGQAALMVILNGTLFIQTLVYNNSTEPGKKKD